jgi:hypothetical protein
MKDYWYLREDLTAAQKIKLKREYDFGGYGAGFHPDDEKILLKVSKGKRDENGIPDFTGVTFCDLISLNLQDFCQMLKATDGEGSKRQTDHFVNYSDYKVRGWYTLTGMTDRIRQAFEDAFGDSLMGGGKSSVVQFFRDIQACSNRGNWARFAGGTLYRGKRISWDKFKSMPWRLVGKNLECTAIYQSKLAMQSWTIDPKVAKNFAAGGEGAMNGMDLEIPTTWSDARDEEVYGRNITGFLPVIIQATVPAKDCVFNPHMLSQVQRVIGYGGLNEKEVLRVSTEPIRAKFTVTREMLKLVTEADEQIDHIFNMIGKRK